MRITAETKAATRIRILETAKKLFAGQGFEPTTTRDIARGSQIATGTLFNYFPTKESIVLALVSEACERAAAAVAASGKPAAGSPISGDSNAAPLTLEEELFAHVAAILRKLKPHRKYLAVVLDTFLSPAAESSPGEPLSPKSTHLEAVGDIAARHGCHEALSSVALQLYWTLYMGVLVFWANDKSPRQEDTLALLDESLGMFVGWLTARSHSHSQQPPREDG
jgi:AcrR family transcriptional regulator